MISTRRSTNWRSHTALRPEGEDQSRDFDKKVPVRLCLNRGLESGDVTFEDVTSTAGLAAMPTKVPHVQIVDIDGDGNVDIVTTASANSGVSQPGTASA